MKIFLTRHGETNWNIEGRMQGRKDSELTELGEEQAKWLSERLEKENIEVILSSTSGRTLKTSEIIRGRKAIDIIAKDQLQEIDAGIWEGMLHKDIKENYPDKYSDFWNEPENYKTDDGESFEEIVSRAKDVLESIIEEYNGKNVLIVTHALFLKAVFTYIKSKPISEFWDGVFMKSTCLSVIEVKNNERYFILEGDISHYK